MSEASLPISICIPSMMEKDIGTTLKYLQQQSVYKQGQAEIVIAEFDRDKTGETYRGAKRYLNPLCRMIPVDKPGIAYARDLAIKNSFGSVICCADADCYFSGHHSIEKLTAPILTGNAVLTGCDNLFNERGLSPEQIQSMEHVKTFLGLLNDAQKNWFCPILLEPGMCFTKKAYFFVNGYYNQPMYEGSFLAGRIMWAYTPRYKMHIPKVACIVSPRRALGSTTDGLLAAYLNYAKAYR